MKRFRVNYCEKENKDTMMNADYITVWENIRQELGGEEALVVWNIGLTDRWRFTDECAENGH